MEFVETENDLLSPKPPVEYNRSKHPTPIVSLGKIIGYRIAGSGVFIKTLDMFRDNVYEKLVSKITSTKSTETEKLTEYENNKKNRVVHFAVENLAVVQDEDTNGNAAQGKESNSKLTANKKASKIRKRSKNKRARGINPARKKSKRIRDASRVRGSHSGGSPNALGIQSRQDAPNGNTHQDKLCNVSSPSIVPCGQETPKTGRRRRTRKSSKCFCCSESEGTTQTRENKKSKNIPRDVEHTSMEMDDSDVSFESSFETKAADSVCSSVKHEVGVSRSRDKVKSTTERTETNEKEDGAVRWADVVSGKFKHTHRHCVSKKRSSSTLQNRSRSSKGNERGKNSLSPCSSKNIEQNTDCMIVAVDDIEPQNMLDEDGLSHFPPLVDDKNRKRKNDGAALPWKLVKRSGTKRKKSIDLPIVRKSLVKEKRQRTKEIRKLAKLKRLRSRYESRGTGHSESKREPKHRPQNGDNKKKNEEKKASKKNTSVDSIFPDVLDTTEGSYYPCYVIDDMREVVIQPVGQFCHLHQLNNGRSSMQQEIKEENPPRLFTVVSVDTIPKPSCSSMSPNVAMTSMNPLVSKMDAHSEHSAMSVNSDEESPNAEVTSKLNSATSVKWDGAPLSASRSTHKLHGKNSGKADLTPNSNRSMSFVIDDDLSTASPSSLKPRRKKSDQTLTTKEQYRILKDAMKVNTVADSPSTPKKISTRYRALLRRDLGKVDAKTATQMYTRGRRIASHQKYKVYDRFESHQQRRTQHEADDNLSAMQTSSREVGEGTSSGPFQNSPQYVWVPPPNNNDQQTIQVIDGVIRTLTVSNNDQTQKVNK